MMSAAAGLGSALVFASMGGRRAWADATPAAGSESHEGHGDAGVNDVVPGVGPWKSEDLLEPEERRAVNGVLETTLDVGYAYHDIGGYRLHMRTYEGSMPGPTLRVQPGDVLRITLTNSLPPNSDVAPVDMELPHHFNTTNFHSHGMHVSPEGISDNIFREMEPGGSYDIEIAVPHDHPRGTYWYHPHHHGSADVQISSGMAGALVVEGDFADVPEIAPARERILVLNEVIFDYLRGIEQYDTVWPEAVPRFLSVNGQREPIIRMRPGEVQRWRVVMAAHENNFRLALDGHDLRVIAYDGIPAPRIDTSPDLVVAPGQRVDLLIQAGQPGSYLLHAIANDQGYPSPVGPLAHVVIEGDPLPMELPSALPGPPLATVHDAEITGKRTLTLSAIEPEFPPAANYQEFAFLVDDRLFDPTRVDQLVRLDAVEEWLIVNEHDNDHVFHIHTNPFQLTQINGAALDQPVWRDTVIVPRNGSVTFRSRFLDFTGKYVLHCHMMNHEELGMMQVVEVSDTI
jgi:FtsP/CotA-like multicopper oxidase with cupredoxin domain